MGLESLGHEPTTVTYTVKELLTEIRQDVKDMRLELNKKADAVEVQALKIQFETFERGLIPVREQAALVPHLQAEINSMKQQTTSEEAVSAYRLWLRRGVWGVFLTLFVTLINLATRILFAS